MKKYILYARVATEQQGQEGVSLNQQVEILKEFAIKNKLEIGEIISEVGSGISKDKVSFNKMLKMLSTGRYEGILCTRIDRISRNTNDFLRFKNFMQKKGLEMIFTEDNLENSPSARFISSVMAAVGEYNRILMSERIKAGIKKAKLEGKNVFATKKQN